MELLDLWAAYMCDTILSGAPLDRLGVLTKQVLCMTLLEFWAYYYWQLYNVPNVIQYEVRSYKLNVTL